MVKSKKKKLVVFVDKNCEICAETMAYLKSKKVSFEKIDLDKTDIDIPFAPIICKVNKNGKNKCIPGFSKEGIDALLKKKGKK